MDQENVLCESYTQKKLTDFFEDLVYFFQDTDAIEEKKKIQDSLKNLTENISYMIVGESGVGKTDLLHMLFQNILPENDIMSGEICEYRWGEADMALPVKDGYERKFINKEEMRGISLIDTRGLSSMNPAVFERLSEIGKTSDAIFAVFDVEDIRNDRVWDLLEGLPQKRMLFFLTKCEKVSQEKIESNTAKLKAYMSEAGISAPIFAVSLKEDGKISGTSPLQEIRTYIRKSVIGENPMLTRQKRNIEEVKSLLQDIQKSFELRKQQYKSDLTILQKINDAMDGYVANQKTVVNDFTEMLTKEINQEIDAYQNEIISKLDPYKIKERFKTKEDFQDYLEMVNDNYKNRMNDNINRKTIEIVKQSLHELEIVFKNAVGYFNQRENILALNDRFYGSLAKSKNEMTVETKKTVSMAEDTYLTLSTASENLFMEVWQAREKYDKQIARRGAIAKTSGSLAGGAGGVAGGIAIGSAASSMVASAATALGMAEGAGAFAGAIAGAVSGIGLVVIGAILGAIIINKIAKTLYDPRAAAKMEEATAESVRIFKEEVDHTRQVMLDQVIAQVTEIFQKELQNADGCFTEFRMSVNIDEQRIPMLESKLQESFLGMKELLRLEERGERV